MAVLLNNGHIILYSLPNLIPFAQVVLPPDRVTMNKLDNNNVSLSEDGRIVVWTGDCELEQYLILLQNNMSVYMYRSANKRPIWLLTYPAIT